MPSMQKRIHMQKIIGSLVKSLLKGTLLSRV